VSIYRQCVRLPALGPQEFHPICPPSHVRVVRRRRDFRSNRRLRRSCNIGSAECDYGCGVGYGVTHPLSPARSKWPSRRHASYSRFGPEKRRTVYRAVERSRQSPSATSEAFRSVCACHMDNPIVASTRHLGRAMDCSNLAAAVDVRLDVDFHLLAAKRTRDQELVWHLRHPLQCGSTSDVLDVARWSTRARRSACFLVLAVARPPINLDRPRWRGRNGFHPRVARCGRSGLPDEAERPRRRPPLNAIRDRTR
jgi:hypothetical protein